eukprot:SAG11_NODE_13310_length_660_cov_3.376114_1_plen_61_part_00
MVISSENRKKSQSKIQLLEVATAARFKATVEAQHDSVTFATLHGIHGEYYPVWSNRRTDR